MGRTTDTDDPESKVEGKEMIHEETMAQSVLSLKLSHNLSDTDQFVEREYIHHMFIFDFPVVTRSTIDEATAAIRRGLEVAFKRYPFLAGMLGPLENSTRGHVQLRYGETEELRQIRGEIFKVKVHKEDATLNCYEELCRVGMPASCLKKEDYCGVCSGWQPPQWVPAFGLQANFLEDGALILCLDFQHSVVDKTSIGLFLEVFTAGIRGDAKIDTITEYSGVDLNSLLGGEVRDRSKDLLLKDYPEFFRTTIPTPRRRQDSHILTMSAKTVREMKHRINIQVQNHIHKYGWVSSTDCIYALLWTYAIRAIRLHWSAQEGHQAMFTTTVDVRKTFKDEVNPSQFGNMITTVAVPTLIDQMIPQLGSDGKMCLPPATLEEIADNAYNIRCVLEEVDQDYVLQRLAILSSLEKLTGTSVAAHRACTPALSGIRFGSLVKLGADIDFGIPGTAADGRPRWCRKPWVRDEGIVDILPRRGGTQGDADWEILISLPKTIMKCMLQPNELGQFIERHIHDNDPESFVRRRAQFPGRRWVTLGDSELRLPF